MIALEARLDALKADPRLRREVIGQEDFGSRNYALRAVTWGKSEMPTVVVAAGVHGDEPEGVEAALRLLETAPSSTLPLTRNILTVLPCLNPSGLALGTRANGLGQDINRQFHADHIPAVAATRRFLQPQQMAALIDLHTDATTTGFYFFELLRGVASLAPVIKAALMEAEVPLEPAPFYAGLHGHDGLIAPNESQMMEFARAAPGASLAQWGWQNGVPRSYVFETPGNAGFNAGVSWHLTALAALFEAIEAEAKAA